MLRIFLSLCLLFGWFNVLAVRVQGVIYDQQKNPLPFATVYAQGTAYGTAANVQGQYFLDLPNGNYTLVFRLVGYHAVIEQVVLQNNTITKDVILPEENLMLGEIKIVAGAEDPAMAIMRKAIAKRKHYLEQVEAYSCRYYTKGNNRLLKAPKKFLGQDLNLPKIDTAKGTIMYLSESVSDYYWQKPNKSKEIMIAAKTSGQPNAFSWNSAAEMQSNLYENLVKIDELGARGFVSPVASNAMLYYKYELVGTFRENGTEINKIKLVPRRRNDPVFRGFIYIQDDTWRIHSAKLLLTKDANIQFVDTLKVEQIYRPVTDDVWLVSHQKFEFNYGLFGFRGIGLFLGSASDFKINPTFEKGFFSAETMKIEPLANKKDSTYWDSVRVVPLTAEEVNDYHDKDSMQVIKDSKAYKDSLDKKSNKVAWSNLLLGYTYSNRYKNYSLSVQSPLAALSYNAVEGWYASPDITFYRRNKEKNTSWAINQTLRYGLASKTFYAKAGVTRLYNPFKLSALRVEAGHFIHQLNEQEPVSPLSTALALWRVDYNAARLYAKNYLQAIHRTEIYNGFMLTTGLVFANKKMLHNAESLSDAYAANNLIVNNFGKPDTWYQFPEYNTLQASVRLSIKLGQKYMTHPRAKIITDAGRWPTFDLYYKKAIAADFLKSTANYDLIRLGVKYAKSWGLFGSTNLSAEHGRFLTSKTVYFQERAHFMGNRVLLRPSSAENAFINLPYYSYSTDAYYTQLHAVHNFNGFLFNKIPLLRRLHLNEYVGINYLQAPKAQSKDYVEMVAGLENIAQILNIDYGRSYIGGKYAGQRIALRLAIF